MKVVLFHRIMKWAILYGFVAYCSEVAFAHHHDVTTTVSPSSTPLQQDALQLEESASVMFDEYWQIRLRESPEMATVLGDFRYDDRLNNYSLKCYEKRKVMMSEFLERANQLLSLAIPGSETEINLLLFISNLQFNLDDLMSGSHLFPVSKMETPQMSLRYLLKYTKLNNAEQYWNLIARYRAIPEQIEEQIELLREGIRTNYTLNEKSMFTSSGQWNQSIYESPFYKPFLNITNLNSSEEINIIQQNASDAILNHLFPAFKRIDDFMQNEYSLHTRPEIGVGSLPNGRDFYQHKLSNHLTDTHVTPEEIHQMGLMEVERITKEMDEVVKES